MTDHIPNDLSHLSDAEFNALCPQGEHAPGPAMTDISSAAKAILDELHYHFYRVYSTHIVGAVYALRVAADQLNPSDKELNETYLAGYYANKNRQGPDCQAAGLRAVLAKWGKDPLFAIADELDSAS